MTEIRLVQTGIADPTGAATPINANVLTLGNAVPASVRLTLDYAMFQPVGFPSRPDFTGTSTPQYPHTIPGGSVLKLLQCEADALITAGAATLA